MKIVVVFVVIFFELLSARSDISAGNEDGTYIQIAKEISSIVAKDIGLNMGVIESAGSKENIKNMIENSNVKFAIVQHDIIQLLQRSKRGKYRRLGENIRLVLPLYTEEVHIIVKKDSNMKYLEDIKNKKIAIGSKGSGTALSALLIFENAFGKNILTSDMIDRSPLKEAMDKLDNGKVDVVFAVGAQPISALERDREYRLIPFDNSMSNEYYETEISSNSYSWLNQNVKVAGVKSFLVCNIENSISPRKMRDFGRNFKRRLKYLYDFGHKRWKEVKKRLPPLPSTQKWRYCKEFKNGWENKDNCIEYRFGQKKKIIECLYPNTKSDDGYCSEEEKLLKLCK